MPRKGWVLRRKIPGDPVFGSAELGFELGFFSGQLTDDFRLGYRSGKRANFVVLDQNRYQEWIPNLKQPEPATFAFITNLLERDFRLAYQNPAYKIYRRTSAAPIPAP